MAFLTPNANGEAAVVGNFVRNQFAQVRSATHGLTDEAWHRRSTVSEFTLATLIDHVGEVAEQYGVGIEASVGGPAEYSEVLTQGEAAPVADRTGEHLLAEFDRRIAVFADLLDRVEAGRTARRKHTGQKADGDGDDLRENDEDNRRVHRQRGHQQMNQLRQAEAERQPEDAAERG